MNRYDLTNTQWERLQSLLPPQKPHTGRPAADHRRILNGILWILRTGAPWHDLPERYGGWSTIASRFYRWRKAGIWAHRLAAVQQQADAAGQTVVHGVRVCAHTASSVGRRLPLSRGRPVVPGARGGGGA